MTAALFVSEYGDNAMTYYRATLPKIGLMRLGWTVWHQQVLVQRDDRRLIGWNGPGSMWTPIPKVVVVRHTRDPQGHEQNNKAMFEEARSKDQRIYVDMDDDPWHLPPWNPAATFFDERELANVKANLDSADGVLCSTPPLADAIREQTSTPVHVCPNSIDVTVYHPHRDHSPLRVGWCGMTDWRINDFAMIADTLADTLRGRDVEFVHLGSEKDRLPIATALGPTFPVPVSDYAYTPFSTFDENLQHIDVAVVPMQDIPLNRCRSATTGLALAAAGIPFIASPTPAYVELAQHGGCLLADTPDDWRTYLTDLITDHEFRYQTGQRARGVVRRHYDPQHAAEKWQAAFKTRVPA